MPIPLPAKPHILVITLRRIGDTLLTTPLIRSLRRAWPSATIDGLLFERTGGILEGNPDINGIIRMREQPAPIDSLRLALRLWRRYDLAISTQTGDRPTFFSFAAGRRRAGLVAGDGSIGDILKRLALHDRTQAADRIHRVEQMLRIADTLGVPRVPELVCPAAACADAGGGDYAVVHAAPMFTYKEWTREGWRALAEGLSARGLKVLAIGGPGEAERRYLDNVWSGSAYRQMEWPDMMALFARARVFVGPDTSVTHLAAAAGCRTVALFGPTEPRIWGPWPVGGLTQPWQASGTIQNRGNVWLVQNPLPCMPCQLEGCQRNINSRSVCLDELRPETVLRAVDQALA
jgi:lipopolysaccharide heptosyltransferase III